MKRPAYRFTADLLGAKRCGRSPKLAPESYAQRQLEFHQRRKFDFLNSVTRNGKSDA